MLVVLVVAADCGERPKAAAQPASLAANKPAQASPMVMPSNVVLVEMNPALQAQILQRIKDHNLPQEAFEWYLDLRRYGTVPHGGFGMGIERVVSWICKLEHVRETIPYPRMLYRLYP